MSRSRSAPARLDDRGDISCSHFTGTIVGLEKISEQHIRGEWQIRGEQVLRGSYHGATSVSYARGEISGSSYLRGDGYTTTEYRYRTMFFARDAKGFDWHIAIEGSLPLLDGHTVTCIRLRNHLGEEALYGLINHNTRQFIRAISRDELLHHLDMRSTKRVKLLVLSPSERREHGRRFARRWEPYRPWLVMLIFLGLTVSAFGVVATAKNSKIGPVLLVLGLLASAPAFVAMAYYYIGRYLIDSKATHVEKIVRNRDLDDALDLIDRYTRDLVGTIFSFPSPNDPNRP